MKMETSAKLYSLNYSNVKTYLFALLFVAGNIALPQLCHLVPYGGPTLLPIYFFTLIAAYKYGFRVGLLTAVLSPVINHVLFAMPSEAEEEAISSLKEKLKDLDTADQNVVVILQMQISEPARCSRQIPGLLFQFRRSVLLYTFYCYFSNFSSILLLR